MLVDMNAALDDVRPAEAPAEERPGGDSMRLLDLQFEQFYACVHRYLLHRVFDRELAEELTAETFFKAAGAVRRMPADERALQMWLLRVATNVANTHHRKQRIRRLFMGRIASQRPPTRPDVDQDDEDATRERLRAMLRTLPAKYQAVIALRYYSEMSMSDIASVLECSEVAVRTRLSRAVSMLRARAAKLKNHEGTR